MGPGGYGMGWMWLWVLLVLVGLLAVVVGLVVVAWRSGTRASGGEMSRGPSSARQILDERFARGEIDDEEYRARRRALDER